MGALRSCLSLKVTTTVDVREMPAKYLVEYRTEPV